MSSRYRTEPDGDEPGKPLNATPRAAPFRCPNCGEPDLRPEGADPPTWRCQTCARVFVLRFVGVRR